MKNLALAVLTLAALTCGSAPARAGRTVPPEQKRYLASLHKKFHAMWVDTVLSRAQQELGRRDPFNLPSRKVLLRLRFAPTGTIRSATVVRSSGHRAFDSTARSVVLGIFDYPRPPVSARSDDGEVYIDWTFHRSRPWCHQRTAHIRKVPFTVSVLGRGHLARAITLLERAQQQGRLRVYGHDFGRQLVAIAVRKLGSRAAPLLVRHLASPQPIDVLRTVFRGSLSRSARRRAVAHLARQKTPSADQLLATLFSINYPGDPADAAIYLYGLALRPSAARAVWKKVRAAVGHPHAAVAAAAARLLLLHGTPDEKGIGEKTLRRLVRSRKPAESLAGLAQIDARPGANRFLPSAKRIVLSPLKTPAVKIAVAQALGRMGSIEAGKVLIMLSYGRRPAILSAALKQLDHVAGPRLPRCYRYFELQKGQRTPAAIRTLAARGLARHCFKEFYFQIKRAVRRSRNSIRLGLAQGLPGAETKAAKLLNRLARDKSPKVRLAALGTMLKHPSRAWRRIMRRTIRRNRPAFRALRCRITKDPAIKRGCFSEARGSARLRLARELVRSDPKTVFPWLVALLKSPSWKKRLRAAWVLVALPES